MLLSLTRFCNNKIIILILGSGVFHFRDFTIMYLMVDSPFNAIHIRQGQDTQGRVFIFIYRKSKLKGSRICQGRVPVIPH